MPFNGSGTFSIINTFVPNTTILSSAVNANFTDIATGLSDVLTRDGQAGMTAAFKAITGSAAAPSITFTSDTTTGLYLVGASQLGLSSGGVLALTLDDAQIGQFVQSVVAKLHMVLNTAAVSTSSNINTLATSGTGAIAIGTSTNWATNGYLLAGNEIMSYTVASANGLTINARGLLGTTSISHATASTITSLYSALARNNLLLPAVATASRPSSPPPASTIFNTGSAQPEFYNGVGWINLGPTSIAPQIRVSPSASTTFITADTTATSLYIYPYAGTQLFVPTGGVYSPFTLSTVATATMSATQTTNGIFDLYAFVSGGALTFGYSPNWSAGTSGSVTAGSCARGTSTGGTVLTTASGFYVNGVAMTLNNGATTYSIATASGILLGSVLIDGTAGQATFGPAYGQNRRWPFSHAISANRTPVYLKEGDSTASWTYTTAATWRPVNNTTANSLVLLNSIAEEFTSITYVQSLSLNNSNIIANNGIGINATTTASGFVPYSNQTGGLINSLTANYTLVPSLGINVVTALEKFASSSTLTGLGGEVNMILTANWRA